MTRNLLAAVGVFSLLAAEPHRTGESGETDKELPLVEAGVLGTVNVLRELDPKTHANRVTVTCNLPGKSGKPEHTIDGGGDFSLPDSDKPLVFTYTLPAVRTVSSLVVAYEYPPNDVPETLRLEGSADGGKTWAELCSVRPRKTDVMKCFRPAKADRLRLTQEGGKSRRTEEVFVYADPDARPPCFGKKATGEFNYLRDLWYAKKIALHTSKKSGAWGTVYGGKSFPHVPFRSGITGAHDGAWRSSDEAGKRVFFRAALDRAYPMSYGVVGCPHAGEAKYILAGEGLAELYTAGEPLDPNELKASGRDALVAQGWVLQAEWKNDPALGKAFTFKKPGKYSQLLLVWDGNGVHPAPNQWSHLELFGSN